MKRQMLLWKTAFTETDHWHDLPVYVIFVSLAGQLCGKPVRAVITLLLQITVIGWIFAAVYAWSVVNATAADKRTARVVKEIRRRSG